jgi:predicted nucleic acid-binding protein
MTSPPFLDTNVLVYFFSADQRRRTRTEELLAQGGTVSVQVLNEFASVARTKLRFGWEYFRQVREQVLLMVAEPVPLTLETHRRAVEICSRYGFTIYDGLILASAVEAGCAMLYTEDLQHGQVVESVRIENPFLGTGTQ